MATWSPDPERIPWLEVVANATFTAAPIVAVDEDGRLPATTTLRSSGLGPRSSACRSAKMRPGW